MLSFEDWFSRVTRPFPWPPPRRCSRSPRAAPRCRSSRATARSRPATSTRWRSRACSTPRRRGTRSSTGRSSSASEIEKQGKLTPELKEKILATYELERLEDLYLPYKLKRKTKAMIAREAGLEPLADWMWRVSHEDAGGAASLDEKAAAFVAPDKNIATAEQAIEGARDIVVERLAEDARPARARAQGALRPRVRAHPEGREGQAEQQVRALLLPPRARERPLAARGVAPVPGDAARVRWRKSWSCRSAARPATRAFDAALLAGVRARRVLASVVARGRGHEARRAPRRCACTSSRASRTR